MTILFTKCFLKNIQIIDLLMIISYGSTLETQKRGSKISIFTLFRANTNKELVVNLKTLLTDKQDQANKSLSYFSAR